MTLRLQVSLFTELHKVSDRKKKLSIVAILQCRPRGLLGEWSNYALRWKQKYPQQSGGPDNIGNSFA